MVAQGQKRKLHKEDERRFSMGKSFHRDQALVKPCLLRSVLINNTLRQHNAPLLSPNAENIEDTFMAWTSEEDFSLSSAISGILKDLDAVIDAGQGPCASQRAPLSSVENLTPCPLRTERTSDMASSIKTELMRPLDKLLLDIDTAVFEPEVNRLQGFSATWEIQEIEHVMDILMRTYPQS
uniref:Zgc:113340 n=1 Tax=Sinocyclocheilus anshuiensis TaxID=1608454 RepID=A0A671KC85_9TELE